jgi:predicted alpha/beta superfamily hydrolase
VPTRLRALLVAGLCAAPACRPASPAPAARAPSAPCPSSPWPALTIQSTVLREARRITVYTPPGYPDDRAARYPVLYLPDGGVEEDFPHVVEAVQAGIRWSGLRPMIVVGIENTDRMRDMAGPTRVAEERRNAPSAGGSAAFRAFLRDELMPAIRARYRTSGEDAIMGESLAGLFVVETFLLEPELFDTYIAFSPSLWWNDQSLTRGAGERLRRRPGLRARLYLTTADEENIVRPTGLLAAALRQHGPPGLAWQYLPMPDQFHDTIYRASAPRALRVLFARPAP